MSDSPDFVRISSTLIESGWRQGSLFTLAGVSLAINSLNSEDLMRPLVDARACSENQIFTLITQDCDLISPDEHWVEALMCSIEEVSAARNIVRRSARKYWLDPNQGVVVDARNLVIIHKLLLATANREEWILSKRDLEVFTDWLSWRFQRPALDPKFENSVNKPIFELFRKFEKGNSGELLLFDEAVDSVRIAYPEMDSDVLTVLVILKDEPLAVDRADAVANVCSRIADLLEEKAFTPQILQKTVSETSLREIYDTETLGLGYITRFGEEFASPTGILRNL